MSEGLRLGAVGAGAVLQVAHLPVLKRLKNVQVTALCDADLPKARALASRFGIPSVYDDIQELLADEALDALLVCTPNHLHAPHILAGLSAGLHVLYEKPLALSASSAQRLIRASERSVKVLMVGMNGFRESYRLIRRMNLTTIPQERPQRSSRFSTCFRSS